LLSSWGIAFEGVDVEAEPGRLAEIKRLGIPLVPAAVIGERFVHGWNPAALAELVGVHWDGGPGLPAEELARRLDRILAAAQRAMLQVPRQRLEMRAPGRDRSVRQLGFHVFRLSLAFADAREQGVLPETWLNEAAPEAIADGAAVARYGQSVRERLSELSRRPGWGDGQVNTYYGAQSLHALLERTTWHAAQHLRQLYWFLDRMGVVPEAPLADTDYAGLPLPRDVWS
jgi:hypothetical protein